MRITVFRLAMVLAATGGAALSVGQAEAKRSAPVPAPAPIAASCPAGTLPIPGGSFQMGSKGEAPPVHPVTLAPYCMDRTEVTLKAYRECWSASACSQPIRVPADESEGQLAGCNWDDNDREEHPINCVTFEQAVSFCLFVDGRLPTEAEWEFAARGTDGRMFPWGNKVPGKKQLLWMPTHKDRGTSPVGSFPAGASPFGLLDMAGSVQEWTADWFGEYQAGAATDPKGPASGDAHPARGGGWATSGAANVQATHRVRFPSATRRDDLGFRCVRAANAAAALAPN
jgi:formylglycine-generating enzyme required for sulfatase activity